MGQNAMGSKTNTFPAQCPDLSLAEHGTVAAISWPAISLGLPLVVPGDPCHIHVYIHLFFLRPLSATYFRE